MFAYYLLVGVPMLLALLMYSIKYTHQLNRSPYQREVIRAFFMIYFLLLAFRAEEIGADTWNYLSKFRNAKTTKWSDPGYDLLELLIHSITDSERIFLSVIAFITVYPIAKLYMEESESPVLTISLFLILPMFQMLFSGLRQAVAMAFVPAAYRCIQERKLLKFLILVWLASFFHRPSFRSSRAAPIVRRMNLQPDHTTGIFPPRPLPE